MIEIDIQYIEQITTTKTRITTMYFQTIPRIGEKIYFQGSYWEVTEVQHEPVTLNTDKPYTKVLVK